MTLEQVGLHYSLNYWTEAFDRGVALDSCTQSVLSVSRFPTEPQSVFCLVARAAHVPAMSTFWSSHCHPSSLSQNETLTQLSTNSPFLLAPACEEASLLYQALGLERSVHMNADHM